MPVTVRENLMARTLIHACSELRHGGMTRTNPAKSGVDSGSKPGEYRDYDRSVGARLRPQCQWVVAAAGTPNRLQQPGSGCRAATALVMIMMAVA